MAGDGTGETLTFWMPLLSRPDGIQIVVTPLSLLGKKNATLLAKAGIQPVSISWETARLANFFQTISSDLSDHEPLQGYQNLRV